MAATPPRHAGPLEFLRLVGHPLRWTLLSELARSDRQVHELTALLGQPQSLVSYHLGRLRDGRLVSMRRSSADRRDAYYSVDLAHCGELFAAAGAALHPGLRLALPRRQAPPIDPPGPAPSPADRPPPGPGGPNSRPGRPQPGPATARPRGPLPRVLFLCTGNSARSQIAEALLRHLSGGTVEARSAGSSPKSLHPNAVRVMREHGIDITGHRSKHLAEFTGEPFDYVITLCDRVREICPEFPGHPEVIHWSIADPAREPADAADSYPAFQRAATDLRIRASFLLHLVGHRQSRFPACET